MLDSKIVCNYLKDHSSVRNIIFLPKIQQKGVRANSLLYKLTWKVSLGPSLELNSHSSFVLSIHSYGDLHDTPLIRSIPANKKHKPCNSSRVVNHRLHIIDVCSNFALQRYSRYLTTLCSLN
jgi:hypothetical protein